MENVTYHIVVLAVAAFSVFQGYRKGFARLVPSAVGTAFGIVCSRLLASGLDDILYGLFPHVHGTPAQKFTYETVSTAIVFCAIYTVFTAITSFLGKILGKIEHSIIDNMAGALFALFRNLLMLSIAFNLICAFHSKEDMLKCVRSDDGNVVEGVLLIAPSLLGGEDILDFSHKLQLEEAKKISRSEIKHAAGVFYFYKS